MADFTAIAAAGQSLERLLCTAFADTATGAPVPGQTTRAELLHAESLHEGKLARPCLALLLHRVSIDRAVRNALPHPGAPTAVPSIPLALHYLLVPFAADAISEHRILGRALQTLEQTPLIGGAMLTPAGVWAPDDLLQLTPEELPPDELLRLFAAVSVPFRASLSYVLRITRFDVPRPDATTLDAPGVATVPARPVVVSR